MRGVARLLVWLCAASVPTRVRAQRPAWSADEARAAAPAPRLIRPATAAYPAILENTDLAAQVTATLTVDAAGRVAPETVRITEDANAFFGAATRGAARRWTFRPARVGGRAVAAPVTVRVYFTPVPASWQPSHWSCSDCNPVMHALAMRVGAFAHQHTACARAFTVVADVNPNDSLAWAVGVVPWCEGASEAAALAVRHMDGGEPDSTLALQARLGAAVATDEVFLAAFAVARDARAGNRARRYALEVLDHFGDDAPRALASADASSGCGAYVVDQTPGPSRSVRTVYAPSARALADDIVRDSTAAPALRAAARCLREDLFGH